MQEFWHKAFLDSLARNCSVTRAATDAGVSRDGAYKARARDPEFAASWQDALEQGVDALEEAAFRRAREGVQQPIVHAGEVVGHTVHYPEPLVMFLLRAHRPSVYRESSKVEVTGKDGAPLNPSPAREDVIHAVHILAELGLGSAGRGSGEGADDSVRPSLADGEAVGVPAP